MEDEKEEVHGTENQNGCCSDVYRHALISLAGKSKEVCRDREFGDGSRSNIEEFADEDDLLFVSGYVSVNGGVCLTLKPGSKEERAMFCMCAPNPYVLAWRHNAQNIEKTICCCQDYFLVSMDVPTMAATVIQSSLPKNFNIRPRT